MFSGIPGVPQEEKYTGIPRKELPGDWEKAASSLNSAPAPRSIHLPSKHNKKGHLKAKLLLAQAEAKHEEVQPSPAAQNQHRPVQAFISQAGGTGSISDISGRSSFELYKD